MLIGPKTASPAFLKRWSPSTWNTPWSLTISSAVISPSSSAATPVISLKIEPVG